MDSSSEISYKINEPITVEQFVELLDSSTLGERRPTDDAECMAGMLENANLLVTAWDGEQLVGVARSVTDYHFACYLSDLAVRLSHQRRGIGATLQRLTQQQLGPRCKIILVAAPAAHGYYGRIGYAHNARCWVLDRDQPITS